MMQIENPIAILRQLKGAPLSVLIALSLARQRVSEQWLARVTGYSVRSVRDGCEYLKEINLADRLGRYDGWILTVDVFQLPLMNPDGERKNFPLDPTTTTYNNEGGKSLYSSRSSIKRAGAEEFSSRGMTVYQENVRNLLRHFRIGEPTASELARLDHVSIKYVMGHFDYLFRSGKGWGDRGLMIHRIRSQDKAPLTDWEFEAVKGEPTFVNGELLSPAFSSRDEARAHVDEIEARARAEVIDWMEYYELED